MHPADRSKSMSRMFILILSVLIGGCQSVTWDGVIEVRDFSVYTYLIDGRPIADAYLECPSSFQSEQYVRHLLQRIMISSEKSNSNGELKIRYKTVNIGGEYNDFIGFRWGELEEISVVCFVRHENYGSSSFDLLKLNENQTIRLKNA